MAEPPAPCGSGRRKAMRGRLPSPFSPFWLRDSTSWEALVLLLPGPFLAVEAEVRWQPISRILVGRGPLLLSLFLIVILALAIEILPLALLVYGALLRVSVLLAGLFVSSSGGTLIRGWIQWNVPPLVAFTRGFVVLHIPLSAPFLVGAIVRLIITGPGPSARCIPAPPRA